MFRVSDYLYLGNKIFLTSINLINNDHLYDLASLTKVLASTLSIMKLYEDFDLIGYDPHPLIKGKVAV